MNSATNRPTRPTEPVRIPCARCGGRGRIACYHYIEGGICFDCNGAGRENVGEFAAYREACIKYDADYSAWVAANPPPPVAEGDDDGVDPYADIDLVALWAEITAAA